MTTLSQLFIQGIRSYDPANRAVIQFIQPLTLITGANGAGKSTLIEALRFACTGKHPSSGFVHDTKLAGQREVRASVALKFQTKGPRRAKCLVNRVVACSEGHMKTVSTDFKYSGGSRAQSSEINTLVPALMGVTQPIIDYVMFCHQEESTWPLMPGAGLEKHFDALFSATQFTKALDEVQKVRKEYNQKMGTIDGQLVVCGNFVERAKSLRKDITEIEESMKRKEQDIENHRKIVQELREEASHLYQDILSSDGVKQKIDTLKTQREEISKGLKELLSLIHDDDRFTGSTDELLCLLKSTESELVSLAPTVDEKQFQNVESKVRELEDGVSSLNTNLAILEKKKSTLDSRLDQCRKSFVSVAIIHGCVDDSSLQNWNSDSNIRDFAEFVLKRLKDREKTLADQYALAQESWNKEKIPIVQKMEELKRVLHNQEGKKDSLLENIQNLNDTLDIARDQIVDDQKAMEACHAAAEEVKKEEVTLTDMESSVSNHLEALSKERDSLTKKEAELLEKRKCLSSRLSLASQCASIRSSVSMTERRLGEIKHSVAELCRNPKLTVLGSVDGKSVAELNDIYKKEYRRLADIVKSAEEEKSKHQQTTAVLRNQLEDHRKRLDQMLKRKKEMEDCISGVVGDGDDWREIPKLLLEKEALLNKKEKKIALISSTEELYKKFIRKANETCKCPLCERRLKEEEGLTVESFSTQLQEVITAISSASSIESIKSEVTQLQTRISELRSVEKLWDEWSKLCKDGIPTLERNVKEIESSLCEEESNLPRVTQVVNETQLRLELLSNSRSLLEQLGSKMKEQQKTEDELTDYKRELQTVLMSAFRDGSFPLDPESVNLDSIIGELDTKVLESSFKDVEKELTRTQESLRIMNTEEDGLKQRLWKQKELVSNLRSTCLKAETFRASLEQKQKHCAETEKALATRDRELKELNESLDSVEKKVNELEQNEKDLDIKHNKIVESARKKVVSIQRQIIVFRSSCEKDVPDIEEMTQEVDTIPDLEEQRNNKEKELNDLKKIYEEMKTRKDDFETKRTQLMLKQNVLKSNLKLRNNEEELKKKDEEIDKAQQNPVLLSDKSKKEKESRMKQVQNQQSEAQTTMDTIQGELNENKKMLRQKEEELGKPELRDAEERYRKCVVDKETMSIMIQDLEKFAKGLDLALISFHKTKMESINRRITELWQATYQNADIDTIQIHSDVERRTATGARTSSSRGTRYSVVMVKDGVEMDMRGRCSSGQKVLASIIIRIALAEIFCQDCSILALDEPTTNLDRRNAEGLAKALNRLILAQKRNSAFQLIIITHDQAFADEFHCEQFYKIVKPERNQFSTIYYFNCSERQVLAPNLDDGIDADSTANRGSDDEENQK